MTYNYRAFHGTRASHLPAILNDGITDDMRRVFFGVAEKDKVFFPRQKSPQNQHAFYGDDSWNSNMLSQKTNWIKGAGADIEIDHRILKDAEWADTEGYHDDPNVKKISLDLLSRNLKAEYTVPRTVTPSEIKRIHVPSLAQLPEAYQDLLYKKARGLNIPVSYNVSNSNNYREEWDTPKPPEFVNARSGLFEVGNERLSAFKDAVQHSKDTGLPITAFYNKPRPDVNDNSLSNYEGWLNNQVSKARSFTGRATESQKNNPYTRIAQLAKFDAFHPDYKGSNTELGLDMQRRIARQEPVIDRNVYQSVTKANGYYKSPQAVAKREELSRIANLETQKRRAKAELDTNNTFDSLQVPQDYRDKILDRVGGYHPDRVKSVWEAVQSGRITLSDTGSRKSADEIHKRMLMDGYY